MLAQAFEGGEARIVRRDAAFQKLHVDCIEERRCIAHEHGHARAVLAGGNQALGAVDRRAEFAQRLLGLRVVKGRSHGADYNKVACTGDEESGMTTRNDLEGDALIGRIAHARGFSVEAVRLMHTAVCQGHGSMAQFDHPEFGGFGQWMRGGMVMLSSTGDAGLKSRVDALCNDLSELDSRPSNERDKAPSEAPDRALP